MTFPDLFRTASRGLRVNLSRSLLTILGIVIGVVGIVLVMSLGDAARTLIVSQVEGIGADVIAVRPGRQPHGPSDVAQTLYANSLKRRDVEALRKKSHVPGASMVEPFVVVPGSISWEERVYRPTIFGMNAELLPLLFRLEASEGALFTSDEVRARARVAVIGARVREEIFGNLPAVGRRIRIRSVSAGSGPDGLVTFRVVGVLPTSGQTGFFNADEIVAIPPTTAQEQLLGTDFFNEILVRADDPARVNEVADDIRTTLRGNHGITDGAKDDFFVVTQQDLLERIRTITRVLTIFLSSIAGISLIVGGVGIMNIMLVSVTERTREIGLRKAVGATPRDILRQFLLEAVLLTASGGVLGTTIALGLSWLAATIIREHFQIPWQFTVPMEAGVLGITMAVGVGLVFGYTPARNAARKHPIEALRYE